MLNVTANDAMPALHLAGWSLGEFGTDAGFTVQAHRGNRQISVTASAAWLALLAYIVRQSGERCR